eukprot:m.83401 g.83401  ORF g.83401 m.83401 type:complete len:165 (-) comp8688_c0_seq4:56-550(-)
MSLSSNSFFYFLRPFNSFATVFFNSFSFQLSLSSPPPNLPEQRFQLIQKKCKVAYNVEFDSRENPELMESVGVFVNNIQLSSYDTPPINVVGWEKEDVISIRTMVHPTPEKTALLHTNLVLLPAHLFIRNCTDWSDFNNAIIKHCVSPHDTRLVDTPYEDDIII